MWMDTKTEVEEASRKHAGLSRRVLNGLLWCTGDMVHLDKYMQGKKLSTLLRPKRLLFYLYS